MARTVPSYPVGLGHARAAQVRLSCQETPKRSFTQPNRRLNPWSPSSIRTAPPSERPANSRSSSSSDAVSTQIEKDGVKVKSWTGGLSKQRETCPAIENEAPCTVPSAPGPSAPHRESSRTRASSNSDV